MDSQETQLSQQPPLPPPLPQIRSPEISKFALKVRTSSPGWTIGNSSQNAFKSARSPANPPSGTYFFYGTLQDPSMLAEILDLEIKPALKPAYVTGYDLKLWGQYPALVESTLGEIIEGSIFEVSSEAAALRLAEYETQNYWPSHCTIRTKCNGAEESVEGWTFLYCGLDADLSEGSFDLATWLKRMGR